MKTEKRLQEAYDIINKNPAVTFLWETKENWPVEFVSENVLKQLWYPADEFTSGKTAYAELIHPDDLERFGQEVADLSNNQQLNEFAHEPYRMLTKDEKSNGSMIRRQLEETTMALSRTFREL